MVDRAEMDTHWFEYFPGHYMWSQAMMMAFGLATWHAADFGDVDRVGRRLKSRLGDNDAWHKEWRTIAEEAEERAVDAERRGRAVTASDAFLRAATYYFLAERFLSHEDPGKLDAYRRCLACFARGAAVAMSGVEKVEVPYERTHLSAYFLPPSGGARPPYPAVVFFDGLDICKEITAHYARELNRRGLAVLTVDGPGQGESLRLQGIPTRHDYEVAAGGAVDYLERRKDVDAKRLGIMALSMGGYYAPRCAAFEKRFKACVAWGAHYDYHALWIKRRQVMEVGGSQISAPKFHLPWVLGVQTMDEAMEGLKRFTLAGVAKHITCPILITHGERDTIVPVENAYRLFDEIASTDKELRVFKPTEGGAEHCQIDAVQVGLGYMADWMAEHL
ncbi:MAG: alpha/beta hydrolase [Candidatus Rokubacteria bacterium]|nr:alpha/beta hydrolase [Candidatus Rokubacteria bacterium]